MDKIDLLVFRNDVDDMCDKNDQNNIKNCSALCRLMAALKYYQMLNISENKDDGDTFEHFINEDYVPVNLVNDYTHLMEEHEENVYDLNQWVLSSLNNDKQCDIKKCQYTYRHYNGKNEDNNMSTKPTLFEPNLGFFCNLFDLMHFYLYHLYETGHRVKMDDIEMDDNEKNSTSNDYALVDKDFARLKAQIMKRNHVTSSFTRFSRKTNTKYTINVNDHEDNDEETFIDHFLISVSKMNAGYNSHDNIVELYNFVNENDYDSDAIQEESKMITNDNGICSRVKNEELKKEIFATLSYLFVFFCSIICFFVLFDSIWHIIEITLFFHSVWRIFATIFFVLNICSNICGTITSTFHICCWISILLLEIL